MTAEDRSQIRDDAGGDGASDAPSDDTAARDPHGGDATGHRPRDEPVVERHEDEPRFQRPEEPRFHRPARSGAAAGEGAARAGGGPSEPGAGDSFGLWLRRQREMREIDLREIADKTKISLRYLKAMEQDRFEVLPAPVFARGFLREYARYVGLNPDEVVNFYLSAHAEEDEGEATGVSSPPPKSGGLSSGPLTRSALLILLVVLVVAALVYLFVYQRNSSDQQEAAPPPIAPPVEMQPAAEPVEPSAVPAGEPAPSAPLVVTLDFTEQCWVEARVDGSEQVSRLFVAGESLRLEAEERVVLQTLGNADGVEVQVNGRPFPVTASPSGTARGIVIDLAAAGVTTEPGVGDTGSPEPADGGGTAAAAAGEAP